MSSFVRPVLATLLLAGAATLLTACDYAKYSPGVNPQFKEGFTGTPGYSNAEVNRDSINYKQNVNPATGEGSATAIKNGSVDDQLNSAPAGKSATTPQTASGKPGPVEQNNPTDASSTAPKANGQ
ncbi:MAG: hypothetical protein EOO59_06360 [Hymenobacter sp.]|nr:MAG: hypothetical protein EOO59_06360 [Hymenobacter sp.]